MRRAGIVGTSMALAFAALGVSFGPGRDILTEEQPRRKVHPLREPSPNDFGPVVDTTPESRRARRRRLAKARTQ